MADQTILKSGLTNLVAYIGTAFKYVAIGNGVWDASEKIPSTTTQLKHEVFRTEVMNTIVEDNRLTIFAAFTGANVVDPVTGIASISEIGLVNTSSAEISQSMFLMKVFASITLSVTDSKVIKIVINVSGGQS